MLVIVSREAAHYLDSSMFIVEGSWETGYVYNEDIFMMEGIKADEWCPIGESEQTPETKRLRKLLKLKVSNKEELENLVSYFDWGQYYIEGCSKSEHFTIQKTDGVVSVLLTPYDNTAYWCAIFRELNWAY